MRGDMSWQAQKHFPFAIARLLLGFVNLQELAGFSLKILIVLDVFLQKSPTPGKVLKELTRSVASCPHGHLSTIHSPSLEVIDRLRHNALFLALQAGAEWRCSQPPRPVMLMCR